MQSHGIEPSPDAPLAPSPAPPVRSVQGLGLTDALRVEFQLCQISGLIDELDELRDPLTETYERARVRWHTRCGQSGGDFNPASAEAQDDLDAAAYALRVLAANRAQVPCQDDGAAFAIVGPSAMMSKIISGAARNAAAKLGELLVAPSLDLQSRHSLRHVAEAVRAWVHTYTDCAAVEWFRFDPDWDPVRAG